LFFDYIFANVIIVLLDNPPELGRPEVIEERVG
jgi:hypothetical protein